MKKPRKSPESLSKAEIETASAESEALQRVRSHRPSVEDYVSEGVLDHMPDVDNEGQINTRIEGHDNVVRALKMNEEARRMESEHFDGRRESPIRRDYREAKEERRARKFYKPKSMFVVPEMPWKRKEVED